MCFSGFVVNGCLVYEIDRFSQARHTAMDIAWIATDTVCLLGLAHATVPTLGNTEDAVSLVEECGQRIIEVRRAFTGSEQL